MVSPNQDTRIILLCKAFPLLRCLRTRPSFSRLSCPCFDPLRSQGRWRGDSNQEYCHKQIFKEVPRVQSLTRIVLLRRPVPLSRFMRELSRATEASRSGLELLTCMLRGFREELCYRPRAKRDSWPHKQTYLSGQALFRGVLSQYHLAYKGFPFRV